MSTLFRTIKETPNMEKCPNTHRDTILSLHKGKSNQIKQMRAESLWRLEYVWFKFGLLSMHKDRKRYSPVYNCKNVDYPETNPEDQKNYGSASGD